MVLNVLDQVHLMLEKGWKEGTEWLQNVKEELQKKKKWSSLVKQNQEEAKTEKDQDEGRERKAEVEETEGRWERDKRRRGDGPAEAFL